jgi:6-phosphofructokinase 2
MTVVDHPSGQAQVLTVTLNPALDISMSVDQLVPDRKLRAPGSRREPGGGGVNVSRVLNRLGVPNVSLVVAGGAVGVELVTRMRSEGLDVIDVAIEADTRESFAITETSSARQYRISVPGPTMRDVDGLRTQILAAVGSARIVVLSGSVPPGTPEDFLGATIDALPAGTTTIVDSSGPALAWVARHSTAIIKPSQRELAELVGWEPSTAEQIEAAAREVIDRGSVTAVVASRGPSGALLATRDATLRWFHPPAVRPVSTVGAGDSMVAGIAAALADGLDLDDAVRLGVAAGTAAVLTPGSGLCEPADVERFVGQVVVA